MLVPGVLYPCRDDLHFNVVGIFVRKAFPKDVYRLQAVIVLICLLHKAVAYVLCHQFRFVTIHHKVLVYVHSQKEFVALRSSRITAVIACVCSSSTCIGVDTAVLILLCSCHHFFECVKAYRILRIGTNVPIAREVRPKQGIILLILQIRKGQILGFVLLCHLCRIAVHHVVKLHLSSCGDECVRELEHDGLLFMVDCKITKQEVFQLLKELCQCPMRKSQSKVVCVPCCGQSVANKQIAHVTILQGREVAHIADLFANPF